VPRVSVQEFQIEGGTRIIDCEIRAARVTPRSNRIDRFDAERHLMLIHTVIAITVSRLLAQSGNGAMSALSPHSGVKRKLDLGAVRSASDPFRTSAASKSRSAAVSCRIVMCYRYPGGPPPGRGRFTIGRAGPRNSPGDARFLHRFRSWTASRRVKRKHGSRYCVSRPTAMR